MKEISGYTLQAAIGITAEEGDATGSRIADALLELAVISGERGYYSLMASLALGRDYTFLKLITI